MEKYTPKIQKETFKIYMDKFWPNWSNKLYGKAYRTFHPSTYDESFTKPKDNFYDFVELLVEGAINDGVKLGLIDGTKSKVFPRLDNKLVINESIKLDWVQSILLFLVIYGLVDEFKWYCGSNGIDPKGEGNCMDDFNCLQDTYETLYDFMLDLENFGIPVGDLIGSEKLKKIPLKNEIKCKHKHDYWRVSTKYVKCDTCGDVKYSPLEPGYTFRGRTIDDDEEEYPTVIEEALEDDSQVKFVFNNLDLAKIMKGPDAILLSDFVEGLRQWGRYNPAMTDLSPFITDPETLLKGELASEIMLWATENNSWPPNYNEYFNEQEDPLPYLWSVRQKVRDAMIRLTMKFIEDNGLSMDMDNVNKLFEVLAKRIYRFILLGPHLRSAQSRKRLDESNYKNPEVEVGDIIQLLHMEDPWKPVPVATKGIVVGFENDPWGRNILVKWIIDPDIPKFKNVKLIPEVDFYRVVGPK
jgi:hypothetical protein